MELRERLFRLCDIGQLLSDFEIDAILTLFTEELRKAFVDGADWRLRDFTSAWMGSPGWTPSEREIAVAEAEAAKRYPQDASK